MAQLYDQIGQVYAEHRRSDPRIGATIASALGNVRTVVNIGAGAGSYEPDDRFVIAVEPSRDMIRQRRKGAAPAIQASASDLPFGDRVFDAAMAILTIHHWPDRERGLAEMRRVARDVCAILTWEPTPQNFWLTSDYLPHFAQADRALFPPWFHDEPAVIDIRAVPIPHDCADGFLGAYWRRPESYLDPRVRDAISTFARVGDFETGLARLRRDLADGTWHRRNRDVLDKDVLDLGYRLVVLQART